MINKLFRFQFKELSRLLFPVMGITAVLMMLAVIPPWLTKNMIFEQLSTVFSFILMIGGNLVMVLSVLIKDYHNFYGKRAYLMHSFPVSSKELFISRILYHLVSVLLITIYAFLQLFFLHKMFLYLRIFPADLQQIYQYIKPFMGWLAIYGATAILLSVFMMMSINTLGAGSRLQRFGVGGPIIVYLLLNVILQISEIIFTLFLPLALQIEITETGISHDLIQKSMFNFYGKNLFDNQAIQSDIVIGIGNVFLFTLLAIVLAIIVNHYMKKRVCLK